MASEDRIYGHGHMGKIPTDHLAAASSSCNAGTRSTLGDQSWPSNSEDQSVRLVAARFSEQVSQIASGAWATMSQCLHQKELPSVTDDELLTEESVDDRSHMGHRVGTTVSSSSLGASQQPNIVRRIVSSKWFDLVIGLIIVANSVTIGLEQTYRKEGGHEQALEVIGWLEHVFLGVYIIELAMRLLAFGRFCLRDNWVRFDVVLVVLGISTAWVMEPIFGQDRGEFAPLMVIRTMRLLRLARMVRLLVKFRVLWMLVRGLLSSAGTMFYTLVLLVIILYVFSAVGVEVITKSPFASGPDADEEFQKIAETYFNSLPSAMLTLMQFVCLDSIGSIYRPLIQKDVTLAIYFALIILVIPIVVMNLVTAIIVNSALEQTMQDKEAARIFEEEKRARLIKKLRLIFVRLDDDKSGKVSRDELAHVSEKDMALLCESTHISDPLEIFAALDVDGSGQISIDEFCNGIWQVVASNSPLEVQRMEKQVAVIFRRLKDVEATQAAMQEVIDDIIQAQEATLEALGRGAVGGSAFAAGEAATEGCAITTTGLSQSRAASKEAASEGCILTTTGLSRSRATSKEAATEGCVITTTGLSQSRATSKEAAAEGCVVGVTGLSQSRAASKEAACEGYSIPTNSLCSSRAASKDLELMDSVPDLLRAGTRALEGGPAWAKELLAELRNLSLELAETPYPSCTKTAYKQLSSISLEDGGHAPLPRGALGARGPMGPPESARPLLFADSVHYDFEHESHQGPPLPLQTWPTIRVDL